MRFEFEIGNSSSGSSLGDGISKFCVNVINFYVEYWYIILLILVVAFGLRKLLGYLYNKKKNNKE